MPKIRPSWKLTAGFVALIGLGYGGWQFYAESQVSGFEFKEIQPKRFNLIAVQPGSGYRVLVSNSVAQLAEVPDGDFSSGQDRDPESDANATNKKIIPLREMMGSLQRNPDDLATLVSALNDIKPEDFPPDPLIWTKEDIEKALAGDPELKRQLEEDISLGLDGKPVSKIRESAIENGIVIDFPVSVKIGVGPSSESLTARVQEPYRPAFTARVHDSYKFRPNITAEIIRASYIEEAEKIGQPGTQPEAVAEILRQRMSEQRTAELATRPERILSKTEVILTEEFLKGGRVEKQVDGEGRETFDLTIKLSETGRMRLWKYSRQNPGFQLLLIVDGVAVAAPRISGELITSEIRITRLSNERLAEDTIKTLNTLTQ